MIAQSFPVFTRTKIYSCSWKRRLQRTEITRWEKRQFFDCLIRANLSRYTKAKSSKILDLSIMFQNLFSWYFVKFIIFSFPSYLIGFDSRNNNFLQCILKRHIVNPESIWFYEDFVYIYISRLMIHKVRLSNNMLYGHPQWR